MADIKDKEYSMLQENLKSMGKGAKKYQAKPDPEHPLPSNIVQKRYTDVQDELTEVWDFAQDLKTQLNSAYDAYKLVFDKAEGLHNKDARTIKGVFGIYNENLRDFGIQPEKQRTGGKPGRTNKAKV